MSMIDVQWHDGNKWAGWKSELVFGEVPSAKRKTTAGVGSIPNNGNLFHQMEFHLKHFGNGNSIHTVGKTSWISGNTFG